MEKDKLLSLIEGVKTELNMVNCNKDVVIKSTGLIVSSVIFAEVLQKVVKDNLKMKGSGKKDED